MACACGGLKVLGVITCCPVTGGLSLAVCVPAGSKSILYIQRRQTHVLAMLVVWVVISGHQSHERVVKHVEAAPCRLVMRLAYGLLLACCSKAAVLYYVLPCTCVPKC